MSQPAQITETLDRVVGPQGPLPAGVSIDPPVDREDVWNRSIPARFRHARPADLDGHLAELAGWQTDCNVLLLGNVGAGKTHAAVATARIGHDAGMSIGFCPVVELLDSLRPGGDVRAFDRAITVGVLILDDIGHERPTDWTGERLYAIVNRRWLEQRPTVVTSNLTADQLRENVGPAMYSRLYHGAFRRTVGGEDRRAA